MSFSHNDDLENFFVLQWKSEDVFQFYLTFSRAANSRLSFLICKIEIKNACPIYFIRYLLGSNKNVKSLQLDFVWVLLLHSIKEQPD